MLNPRIEPYLSALSLQCAKAEASTPSSKKDSLSMSQRVNTSLSYVSRKNPVGVALITAAFDATPSAIDSCTRQVLSWLRHSTYGDSFKATFGDDCTAYHLSQLARLATLEVVNLGGCDRCEYCYTLANGVVLADDECGHCQGTGFANNQWFSERRCAGILNNPELPEPIITRHQWRTKLKAPYRAMVTDLLQLVVEAGLSLQIQMRH